VLSWLRLRGVLGLRHAHLGALPAGRGHGRCCSPRGLAGRPHRCRCGVLPGAGAAGGGRLIDWDTTLLPDDHDAAAAVGLGLVAPALGWLPVVAARCGLGCGLRLLVAVVGVLAFKLATGKEGMGEGDFKLLAAWAPGWAGRPALHHRAVASAVGAVVGIWHDVARGPA
jgi:hypothetical protein